MQTKTFPATYGFGDVSVTLHADGRIEGDLAAYRKALAEMPPAGDAYAMMFWLLGDALERQTKERADAR